MLTTVDSHEGRQRVAEYLSSQPFPHYEPAPGSRGLLVRIEASGRRTVGKFVSGEFRPAKTSTAASKRAKKASKPATKLNKRASKRSQ
jgi:hypothetical protein